MKNSTEGLEEPFFKHTGAKYSEQTCKIHSRKGVPFRYVLFPDGRTACPRCFRETHNYEFEKKVNQDIKDESQLSIVKHLEKYSVISNAKVLDSRFDNYKTFCNETKKALAIAEQCAKWYKFGNNFNMVLNGNTGVGKSHLAYAIAKSVSEKRRCLFISVPKMFSLVYDSINNKDSRFTKSYFEKIMSEVDILIIDDLGAEVGRVDTTKQASDFMSGFLFNVYESRQGKSTITTSNLLGARLNEIYDERMFSRLKADTTEDTVMTFRTATDKRKGLK